MLLQQKRWKQSRILLRVCKMKYFYSPTKADYSKYLFPYQVYLIKEEADSAEEIYAKGFLPVRTIYDLYYLARSTRVDLGNFELSSENRRILRKVENFYFEVKDIDKFKLDESALKIIRQFAKSKFDKALLKDSSLKKIFSVLGNYNKVACFSDKIGLQGLAVLCVNGKTVHYAHPFYAIDERFKDLGLGMMTSVVDWASASSKKYVYLGTVYGKSSLYKTQFKGFEFFDGVGWSIDIGKLKEIIKLEEGKFSGHLLQNKSHIKKYYNFPSLTRLVKKLKYEL